MTPPVNQKPAARWPDFPYTISRPLEGIEEQEIAIEVTYYRPPTVLKPGQYMSTQDPAFDSGEVCFGHAFTVPDGKPITLTLLEEEAAERAFWDQMN